MPTNTLPPIEPGTRLTDFSELDMIVEGTAAGGMGLVVWGKNQPSGNEMVALKLVDPDKATIGLRSSFEREALHWCGLWFHPSLIRALGTYKLPGWDYLPVLAMEYAPHGSLQDVFTIAYAARLPLPPSLPLAWAQQIASALVAMHAPDPQHGRHQPLIHCDLKPGNILVTSDGVAKVTDLGLARVWAHDDAAHQFATTGEAMSLVGGGKLLRSTRVHSFREIGARGPVVGTIPYMPPEQWMGVECIVPESDIYALGVILFQLFAGVEAFPHVPASPGHLGWYEAHVSGPTFTLASPAIRALSLGPLSALTHPASGKTAELAREILNELDSLIQDCLAGDPSTRPTASQVLGVLNFIAQQLGTSVVSESDGEPRTPFTELLYWTRMGTTYRALGMDVEALASARNILHLAPQLSSSWLGLASALVANGELQEAWDAYVHAMAIANGESEPEKSLNLRLIYYGMGQVLLFHNGQPLEAIQPFEMCLELDVGNASAWHNLGIAHWRASRTIGNKTERLDHLAKAYQCISRVLEFEPHDPIALKDLGDLVPELQRAMLTGG